MLNNKRIDELDLLKTIAIIMVVAQHVPLYNCDFFNDGYVIQYFFKLLLEGVPLFFAVNGFLLLKKDNLDIKKHYKKVVKMIFLVFIWEIILITIGMMFDGTKFNFGLVLDLFFRGGLNSSIYTSHLWFMQALIAIYCVYPLIWDAYHYNYELFKVLFIIICFFTIVNGSIELISNLFNYDGYAKMINYVSSYIERFDLIGDYKWQLFYFCLGGIVQKNLNFIEEKRTVFIIIGFLCWCLAFGYGYCVSLKSKTIFNEYFNANTVFMVLIVLGWFALFINYKSKSILGKIINYIGKNTFGIYIIHTYFLRTVDLFINNNTFFSRLLNVWLTLLISLLFTIITKKIPYLGKILEL